MGQRSVSVVWGKDEVDIKLQMGERDIVEDMKAKSVIRMAIKELEAILIQHTMFSDEPPDGDGGKGDPKETTHLGEPGLLRVEKKKPGRKPKNPKK